MIMITVADVIDAIEKNGYKQIVGDYVIRQARIKIGRFNIGPERVIGACALGQAALNLNVKPEVLAQRLTLTVPNSYPHKMNVDLFGVVKAHSLYSDIVTLNDIRKLSLKEIAEALRTVYKDQLNEPIYV